MPKKTDLRIIKTRRNITESFLKLMYAKGFDNLTVNEILDEAMINRSTFYAHYRDKHDLRDQIEQEFVDDFVTHAMSAFHSAKAGQPLTEESLRSYLSSMIAYINEHRVLVSYLIGPDGDPAFAARLTGRVHKLWVEFDILTHLNVPENYASAALSGTLSSLLLEWARSGFEDEEEQVTGIMLTILTRLARSIVIQS